MEDLIETRDNLFQNYTQDKIVSYFLDSFLTGKNIEDPTNQFIQWILETDDIKVAQKMFPNCNIEFKAPCSKIVEPNQLHYMCVDCDLARPADINIYALLCYNCFKNSNHTGHRVLLGVTGEDERPGCDCGNPDLFKSEGFCSSHSNDIFVFSTIQPQLDQSIHSNFKERLIKIFHGIFLYAEASLMKLGKIIELVEYSNYLNSLLELLSRFITEVHPWFASVISDVLLTELQDSNVELFHSCKDLSGGFWALASKPSKCKCTILDLIFRYNSLHPNQQVDSILHLLSLLQVDEDFRQKSAFIYVKNFCFITYLNIKEKRTQANSYSKLSTLQIHLFSRLSVREKVAVSPYFDNIFEVLRDAVIVESYDQLNTDLIWKVRGFLKYFLSENSSSIIYLIKEKDLILRLYDYLIQLSYPIYPYQISIKLGPQTNEEIKNNFTSLSYMIVLFRSAMIQLTQFDQDFQEKQLKILISMFLDMYEQFSNEDKKIWLLQPIVSRSLFYIMRRNSLDMCRNAFNFITEELKSDAAEMLKFLIYESSKQISITSHFVSVDKPNNILTFIYCQQPASTKVEILFDLDILNLQNWLISIKEDPFDTLISSYFGYDQELLDYFETLELNKSDTHYRKRILKLEEFFTLLIFLMQDEACHLNNTMSSLPRFLNDRAKEVTVHERISLRYLKNFLVMSLWMDPTKINEYQKAILMGNWTQKNLSEITEMDSKTGKVKLKKEYYKDIDPYLFFFKFGLQKKIIEGISSINQKNVLIDHVSGIFYEDLPENLYILQSNLLSGKLLDQAIRIVASKNQIDEVLLRPLLRIILYYFELKEFLEKNPSLGKTCNLKARDESEFIDLLNVLPKFLEDKSLLHYHNCIRNILNRISKKNEMKLKEDQPEIDEKKRLALEKKLKLEQEFKMKRDAFQNKNLLDSIEKQTEEKDENKMCQICNVDFEPKDCYGYPIFISKVVIEDTSAMKTHKVIFKF